MSEDRDLEDRFAKLRSEDARAAAPAARTLARVRALRDERPDGGSPARIWLTVGVALAAALALWLALPLASPPASDRAELPEFSERELAVLGSLRTPTDSLLEIGTIDMLGKRPPELLPLPELPRLPVRESRNREHALS